MTVRELVEQLNYENSDAIVCLTSQFGIGVYYEVSSIEGMDKEEYYDTEGELKTGKIIVL